MGVVTDEDADRGGLAPACERTKGTRRYHTATPTDALFAFYDPCPHCFEDEAAAQDCERVIRATGSNATLVHEPAGEIVYHVVCRECTHEHVCRTEGGAKQRVLDHHGRTGHDVAWQAVIDP